MNLNENNFIEIISNSKGGFTHLSLFINHNGDSVTESPLKSPNFGFQGSLKQIFVNIESVLIEFLKMVGNGY